MVQNPQETEMKYIFWGLIILFAIFVSVIYPPIFSIGGFVRIDILIVALSLFSLYLSPFFTLPVFFFTGLIVDSFYMTPLGYHSLVFLSISYVIFIVKDYIFKEKFLFQILVISMSVLIYRVIDTVIYFPNIKSISHIFYNLFLSPMATVLFYSLIYVLVKILGSAVSKYGKRKQTL